METTIVYWGNIGIMKKKMETTIVYWGNMAIMEKNMETTIVYWVLAPYQGMSEARIRPNVVAFNAALDCLTQREAWNSSGFRV